MSKRENVKPAGRLIPERTKRFTMAAAPWVTAAFIVLAGIGVRAENATVKNPGQAAAPQQGAKAATLGSAKDPMLQGRITKAKGNTSAQGAKAAAERYEALEHGHPVTGTDQMQLIMHGYVPPGMPPQQAEWTRADCYLWCSRNCDPDDFQSCCDECAEHYDD